jgi:hypothetical protein
MIRSASALVVLVGLAAAAEPVSAQSVCANRDVIVTKLQQDFSEAPSALGMSDNGAVIEVLASKDGTTWTILMTTPDGVSCVVATGEAWEPFPADQIAAAREPEA